MEPHAILMRRAYASAVLSLVMTDDRFTLKRVPPRPRRRR